MANYGPPDGAGEPWRSRRPDEAYGRSGRGWQDAAEGPDEGYGPRYDAPRTEGHAPAGAAGFQGYGGPPGYGDSQSYGDPQRYGGAQGHGDPQGYGRPVQDGPPGYAPEPYRPAYQTPSGPAGHDGGPVPPTRPSRGRGPLIAVLAAVVLLLLGGGTAVVWLLGRSDDAPAAAPSAPVGESAPVDETSPMPSVAAPESSADPRFVKVGECVRNDGPAGGKPKLLISECAPKSYEVLHRVDGPTTGEKDAAAKCAAVDGYTNWYFFDSELDTLDFVLCLKQR